MVTLTTSQDLELEKLRQTFLAHLPERVRSIEAALDSVLGTGGLDDEPVEALFHLAHRLCGSAGIYGYQTVHVAADALERRAEGLRSAGAVVRSGQGAELRALVEALKRASGEASGAEAAAAGKPRPRRRRNP